MNIRFTILTFLFTQIFYCQVNIQEDNLTIEYAKTKKASQSLGMVTNVRTKSKEVVQYNIKIRVEMLDNKKRSFDANKFSLVDYQDSIRLRPIDVAYTNLTDKWHFIKLIKNKPKYKSLEKRYKPDIKDTFLDYEFEGINNLTIPICYEAYDKYKISFKNPDKECHESYFEPKDLRKRNVNLYFPMLKSAESATLYYGNTKITEINLK
ncbi:hypothetical protein ESY86_19030 [Subsaximicrobium wynnwilliamsii]|uniref:DUF3108 domain-containing protein n=1 Tax=Subsaximicrobium wynnwilliamsii TaxID=291179 RepID=A0A5C6ZBL0_9FLAO|nr:hypothetical protein [Subsaximicrobium wynnwilliamsii]TXD81113.1 hypothetical protein ESY87_19230 [Subsaximicrobium wynnwilliamsii]TXD86850.1 hypothetical protein ESY86_19030 [Subsaximicrobium wynnwilliamsii]TXE00441.1 hypothetical protein ESY88_19215 [Subsaximicrobium wynnwilliamsii]